MVEFTLPKNSKITEGKTWPRTPHATHLTELRVYRWSPDDGENPRIDTYFVDRDDCGPMVLDAQGDQLMTRTTILAALVLAASTFALPAVATPADLDIIERECGTQLKMPPGGCKCLRERAAKLNDKQQQFIAVVVMRNNNEQSRIQKTMTQNEMIEAGMFMTEAPTQCTKR